MSGDRNFYVYVHRTSGGTPFYVGKGTGKRAWTTEGRHLVWTKYVADQLGGKFTVEIHRGNLTEGEALRIEGSLIERWGRTLVNWVNVGREFDYDAIAAFHQKRNANRLFVRETRSIEKADLVAAIERYRQAIVAMEEYEAMEVERGLVADLMADERYGDIGILDRLTLCLLKALKDVELVEATDRYFGRFPKARQMAAARPILARAAKATARLRRTTAPSPSLR